MARHKGVNLLLRFNLVLDPRVQLLDLLLEYLGQVVEARRAFDLAGVLDREA